MSSYNELREELVLKISAFIEANMKEVLTVLLIASAVVIVFGVITIVANWRIFEKAGEHGWCCLIPFVNGHVSHRIAWHPFFYWVGVLASLGLETLNTMQLSTGVNMPYISLVSLVLSLGSLLLFIAYNVKLSRAFGHGVGFAVGLMLLPMIFIPILGFGSSVYEGKIR